MFLQPWTSDYIRLAQQYENLWMRVYWDGTPCGSILDLSPVEGLTPNGAPYWVRIYRGILIMGQTEWCLMRPDRLAKMEAMVPVVRKPVDAVPWEIHGIENPVAYAAARSAYIASRSSIDD